MEHRKQVDYTDKTVSREELIQGLILIDSCTDDGGVVVMVVIVIQELEGLTLLSSLISIDIIHLYSEVIDGIVVIEVPYHIRPAFLHIDVDHFVLIVKRLEIRLINIRVSISI